MKTLKFEIKVHASVDKVYKTLIDQEGYAQWTKAFNVKSRYEGNWSKGSEMLFIGENPKTNEVGGMVSRIADLIQNEFISIQHLGLYKNGEKLMSGPEVDTWVGSFENFSFSRIDNGTKLTVDIDSVVEFQSYFEDTFPKALILLKDICENNP